MRQLFPHLYVTTMEKQEHKAPPVSKAPDSDRALAEAPTMIDPKGPPKK
jgi:hypothetical protein